MPTSPPPQPPPGLYLTCQPKVGLDAGGQTGAMLMRNRILSTVPGVIAKVLTVDAQTDYPERRDRLVERGLLVPAVELTNIYDHYRAHGWRDEVATGSPLRDLSEHRTNEECFPDGSPWRTTYQRPGPGRKVFDYLLDNGNPYLRIPSFDLFEPSSWPKRIQRVSPSGEVLGRFRSIGQWWKTWVRDQVGDELAFVFSDAREMAPHLTPIAGANIYRVQVVHSSYLRPPRRWNSTMNPEAERMLDRVPQLDALVTLTTRQRGDLAERLGRTNNLFVVPNPVDLPRVSHDDARDPKLATIVARLEGQKRLGHAVEAFARVLAEVPDARLDIYGEGGARAAVQNDIDVRDLGGSVTLKGYDPNARDALWRSSAFLMTSRFEGYPLATLESLSHGCPVVSYDIKYGPREQITDGFDGFLVPDGDVVQLADRVAQLLKSPSLVRRMSAGALETAREHDADTFVADWSRVLSTAMQQRAERTTITKAHLTVEHLDIVRCRRSATRIRRGHESPVQLLHEDDVLHFRGALRVRGRGTPLASASVELSAVRRGTGVVVALPVEATLRGDQYQLDSRSRLGDIVDVDGGSESPPESTYLRLRLVWGNSAWETSLTVPPRDRPEIMAGSSAGDVLVFRRGAPEESVDDAP